jgi:hypothetical protein
MYQNLLPDYSAINVTPCVMRQALLTKWGTPASSCMQHGSAGRRSFQLDSLFNQYSAMSESEWENLLRSENPEERAFWEQINRSHIYDKTFSEYAGYSYFEILKSSGIWRLLRRAFNEAPCRCVIFF